MGKINVVMNNAETQQEIESGCLIAPREYQTECVSTIRQKWNDGVTSQLVILPTGTGKTIVLAQLVKELGRRTLILAHRDELLTQAAEKILRINPDADIGIFKGKERGGLEREICIASVQTATRHTDKLKTRNFILCICDEAHHATAKSYRRIFDDLGFLGGDPSKLLLGVTATPFRADDQSLKGVFEEIVFERFIQQMIIDGFLVAVRGIRVGTNTKVLLNNKCINICHR